MLVTFRIIDTETRLHSAPAILSARELATLTRLLAENALAPDLDEGQREGSAYHFEFNANRLPLARIASALDWRGDVISVVEEAQFLGRSLRIERVPPMLEIALRVSDHIALTEDLILDKIDALTVAGILGVDFRKRSIKLADLAAKLARPSVEQSFYNSRLSHIHYALSRAANIDCGEQSPVLEWA